MAVIITQPDLELFIGQPANQSHPRKRDPFHSLYSLSSLATALLFNLERAPPSLPTATCSIYSFPAYPTQPPRQAYAFNIQDSTVFFSDSPVR